MAAIIGTVVLLGGMCRVKQRSSMIMCKVEALAGLGAGMYKGQIPVATSCPRGFRVYGLGFRVLGSKVWGLAWPGLVSGLGLRFQGRVRVCDLGIRGIREES